MPQMAGLPFWEFSFDAAGSPSPAAAQHTAPGEIAGLSDLFVFAHGWNSDPAVAERLYRGFFGLLAGQLPAGCRVGLAGVIWPSQRWPDEPFSSGVGGADGAGAGGAAAAHPVAGGRPVLSPELDGPTLALLHDLFPAAAAPIDAMAALLTGAGSAADRAEFFAQMHLFAELTDSPDGVGADLPAEAPALLAGDPGEVFRRFGQALQQTGALLGPAGDGTAGLGSLAGQALHGAKEALRQLTYWQMKKRAGTVGRSGLAPLLGRLRAAAPGLRVHLIGHSFGARLVSYAILTPNPVKSVTLIEGAFSQWAFAPALPWEPGRGGALVGVPGRVDGPLVAVHSRFDGAVGTFYPLASMSAGDDSSGVGDTRSRWGGMGANGAQGAGAKDDAIRGAGPGQEYPFARGQVLNVDASDVVRTGPAPSGAHSDIVHPEITRLVLGAAGLD